MFSIGDVLLELKSDTLCRLLHFTSSVVTTWGRESSSRWRLESSDGKDLWSDVSYCETLQSCSRWVAADDGVKKLTLVWRFRPERCTGWVFNHWVELRFVVRKILQNHSLVFLLCFVFFNEFVFFLLTGVIPRQMEVDFSLLLAVFLQHLVQLLSVVIANKSHCWRGLLDLAWKALRSGSGQVLGKLCIRIIMDL